MKTKILLSVATLVVAILFLFVPAHVYNNNVTAISVLGALVTTALLAFTLFTIFPTYMGSDKERFEKDRPQFEGIGLVIVFFFIIFVITLIMRGIHVKHDTLKEEGKFAFGVITDGEFIKRGRVNDSHVTVTYKDDKGKEHKARVEILASEFENYSLNQDIALLYLPDHTEVVDLIYDDAIIEKFTHKKQLPITYANLEKLLNMEPLKASEAYLNTLNFKWALDSVQEPGTYQYSNTFRRLAIQREGNEALVYMHNKWNDTIFDAELKAAGFTMDSILDSKIFKKKGYTVMYTKQDLSLEEEIFELHKNINSRSTTGSERLFPKKVTLVVINKE